MSDHVTELSRLADLRSRAASRLTGGAAAKGATARAADALAVLHALASSPETAADALALLHELQVHQVELDLQAEELRESRAELESALRRQIEVYDFQPVGCFTVNSHLVVLELNRTAAAMLGVERDDALGLSLGNFLGTQSRHRLKELLSSVGGPGPHDSALLQWCPKDGPGWPVRAHVDAAPSGQRYFVVLASAGEEQGPTSLRAAGSNGRTPS